MKKFLTMRYWSPDTDLGLLLLRVGLGLVLLTKHGLEKPSNFAEMAAHFPDPIHIGPTASLVFALVSDAICSVLIVIGLATRWSALIGLINIGVAWTLVHHFAFLGKSPQADHGEVCVLYLVGLLAILVAGPGRYSLDETIAASDSLSHTAVRRLRTQG